MAELMTDWMTPLLTQEDADRLVGWHLGVSLYQMGARVDADGFAHMALSCEVTFRSVVCVVHSYVPYASLPQIIP